MLFNMKNKIPFKKVIAYLGSGLMVLTLFFAMPVSAESGALSAPFVGFNVHIMDIDAEYKYIDSGNYSISSQGGTVTGQLNCSSWRSGSSSDGPCDVYELEDQSNSYVNGLRINLSGLTVQNVTNDTFTGTIYKRIYEIEFVLDDSYVGYVTFSANSQTYTSYVNGTSFHQNFWSDSAESFTISITDYSLSRNKLGYWDFPIESFTFIDYLFTKGYEVTGFNQYNSYNFPMFNVNQNNSLFYGVYGRSNGGIHYILWIDKYVIDSTFSNYFQVSNSDLTVSNFKLLNRSSIGSGVQHCLISFDVINPTSSNIFAYLNYVNSSSAKIMPIYAQPLDNKYISTDFALNFGLRNELLDNLNILANGTTSTNQSASNTNQENSNLQDSQSDLFSQEDSFNDSLNNSLNNIDPDFNIGTDFGSKFINSADWVKTQFDRVTGNTPFGSVLGFSLLLGVGLLIIGKVLG